MEAGGITRKKRILCLHGFRSSGNNLKKEIMIISRWDPSILDHFDMDFPNGPYPAAEKPENIDESIFPPPYFEWFQRNEDFTEFPNLEGGINYICNYITTKGPFDGLLGFSQGSSLAAVLLGYQAQGNILKEHPAMKMFISISGCKLGDKRICEVAFKSPIKVKSVHFIGDKDWLKKGSEELATEFEDPLIIRHPENHNVPRLDKDTVKKLINWIMQIDSLESSRIAASVETEHETKPNAEEPEPKGSLN